MNGKKLLLALIILIMAATVVLTGCFPERITISFETNGGESLSSVKVPVSSESLDLPTPVRNGYVFDGWYYDSGLSSKVDIKVIPEEDCTFYAKWTPQLVTVTFNADDVISYKYVSYGSDLPVSEMPAVPEKPGYEGRWLTDGLTDVTAPVTIFAQYFLASYSVTYVADGEQYAFYQGLPGDSVLTPDDPEKEDYYFYGWYYDTAFTQPCLSLPVVIPDSNLILYARFLDNSDMSRYISYTVSDGEAKITGLTSIGKNQTLIIVPETLGGVPVTSIGDSSNDPETGKTFASDVLTTLVVPGSVKSIGDYAFFDIPSLTEIKLEEGLLSVGKGSFAGLSSLTKISLPSSLETVGDYAFASVRPAEENDEVLSVTDFGCEVTIAPSVLTEIVFSSDSALRTLGKNVLSYTAVTSFTLPEAENYTFDYRSFALSSLTEILSVNPSYVSENGALYSADLTDFVYLPVAKGGDFTVSDGTISVSEGAFLGNKNIVSVSLPDSVESIETRAFYGCSALENVSFGNSSLLDIGAEAFAESGLRSFVLPDSVQSLGKRVFADCVSLSSFSYSGLNLEAIPDETFYNCASLTAVTITGATVAVGDYAFYGCASLSDLIFPAQSVLEEIGSYAFYDCASLKSFSLPSSLRIIGSYAFAGSERIFAEPTIPSSITYVGDYAFMNSGVRSFRASTGLTYLGKGAFKNCTVMNRLVLPMNSLDTLPEEIFYGCSSLSTVNIPANFTSIGARAFYNCTALTGVTFNKDALGKGVVSIGESAFENCVSLLSDSGDNAILPSTLTSLGKRAFYNCSSLTEVVVPAGLQKVSEEAFANCSKVNKISFATGGITDTLGENSFAYCTSLVSVTLPSALALRNETGDVGAVKNPFFGCSSLAVLDINNSASLKSIDGFIYYEESDGLKSVYLYPTGKTGTFTLGNDFSSIDDYAFYGSALSSFNLSHNNPSGSAEALTLVKIGSYAFAESELTSAVLSRRIYFVGPYAFADSALNSLTVEETFTEDDPFSFVIANADVKTNRLTLGEYAFSGTDLVSLSLPLRVETVGKGAFSDCYSLKTVLFADGNSVLLTIEDYAFANNSVLSSLSLPSRTASVGSYAFAYCRNVSEIVFADSDGTLTIGDYAFASAHYLRKVVLPSSLLSMGEGVFSDCSRLYSVTFPESLNAPSLSLPAYAFYGSNSLLEIYIPGYISEIGEKAFFRTSIVSVEFADEPAGSLVIGASAFENVTSLTSVYLPSQLVSVGEKAFYMSGLSSLSYGEGSVFETGNYAFSKTALENVVLSERFLPVGEYVFADNPVLKNVSVESSQNTAFSVYFGDYMFKGSALESVIFPSDYTVSVSSIGKEAFADNAFLSSLSFAADENGLTLGEYAFRSSAISSFGVSGKPSYFTVKEGAFFQTPALESIDFAASVMEIGDFAFARSGITSLVLDADVFSAGKGIAYGSVGLSSVILTGTFTDYETVDGVLYKNTAEGRVLLQYPAGKQGAVLEISDIYSIEDYAFYGNAYLTTITVLSDAFIPCGTDTFTSTNPALTVYTSAETVDSYSAWGLPVSVLRTEFDGFVFTLLGNGRYEISGYTGTAEEVTVQGSYSVGETVYRVESIGDNAFLNNTAIRRVTIGTGINSVGKYAFSGCTSLERVTFGNNVAIIKNHAFYGCSSLSEINFNATLDFIEDYAFANCPSLENVAFPDSLESIGAYSFAASALSEIDFGNGLHSLGDNAFENSVRLVEVRLPSSINSIGDYVFRNCENLTFLYLDTLTVPALKSTAAFRLTPSGMRIFVPSYSVSSFKTATYWREYSTQILSVDNISSIIGKENYVLTPISNGRYRLVAYIGEEKNVFIDPVLDDIGIIVEIGEYAFSQFTEILEIGEGVTSIAPNAFRNAVSLVSVTLPESVRTLGSYAFAGLSNLETVVFDENSALTSIDSYAFYDCVSLTSIILPPNLSSLGKYAFSGSNGMNLETIVFRGYATVVLSIDDYAFAGNGKITEMVFDCAVSRFGEGAFADCVSLEGIYLNSTGNVIAAIDPTSTEVFANCDLLSVFVPGDATLRSYQQSWTSQYDRLRLVNASYIAKDVTVEGIVIKQDGFVISPIGSSTVASIIGYIGDETEVVFPSSVIIGNNTYTITRIGRTENNSTTVLNGKVIGDNVTKITIPNSVTEITGDAFRRTRLTEVVFAGGSTLSSIGRYAFAENPLLTSVSIPKSVSSINEYAFAYNDSLSSVTFEEPGLYDENILAIREYAFAYCNSLESLSFPKHLSSVGGHAFDSDSSLGAVTFHTDGQIGQIGEYAFARTALVSIDLPMSVASVANYAFAECNDLVYVRLYRETGNGINSLTSTYDNVFYGISNPFVRVYVPERSYTSYKDARGWSSKNVIPDLQAGEFNYLMNASGANTVTLTAYTGTSENVVIPVNLTLNGTVYRITTIASYFGNASLKSVSFASGSAVTTLEARAFASCTSLERIVLPDSVQNMGEYAFAECYSLFDVTLSENLNSLSAYAFYNCGALKEITVPASVATIGNASFLNCTSLNRLTIDFTDATALGLSALVGTHPSLVILVPEGRQNAFANQWLDYSNRIFDLTERYGDFVLTANESGYTLIQYNGYASVLDLTTLTVNGKKITEISDGAVIHDGTEIIR